MITIEELSRFYASKYATGDRLAYASWLLSQPASSATDAWKNMVQVFGRYDQSVLRAKYRAWLLPTFLPDPNQWRQYASDVDQQYAGKDSYAGPYPRNEGYYVTVQLSDEAEGLVLLEDYSWGPLFMHFPSLEDPRERLTELFIPMLEDSSVESCIDLKSDDAVRVQIAWEEVGYGPQLGLFIVNVQSRDELIALTVLEDLKRDDPRWKEERDELMQDIERENPNATDDDKWQKFDELLREGTNAQTLKLDPWNAASLAVEVTEGAALNNGIEQDWNDRPVLEDAQSSDANIVYAMIYGEQWQLTPMKQDKPTGSSITLPVFHSERNPNEVFWVPPRVIEAAVNAGLPEKVVISPGFIITVDGAALPGVYISEALAEIVAELRVPRGRWEVVPRYL